VVEARRVKKKAINIEKTIPEAADGMKVLTPRKVAALDTSIKSLLSPEVSQENAQIMKNAKARSKRVQVSPHRPTDFFTVLCGDI